MQYTMGNVRRCMDLMDYVQTMILRPHCAGISKDLYQLALAVYYHIDGPLRQDIQCPCKKKTVEDIIARIHKLQDVWFNTYTGCQNNPTALFQHCQADRQVQVTRPVQSGAFNVSQASGHPSNMYSPRPNNGPYQESYRNRPNEAPQKPYRKRHRTCQNQGYSQPGQDTNQEYNKLGYLLGQPYEQPTNAYH